MKKIDLLLTRHGETIENQRHVLQGQLPGTLSPLGKEQAVVLAEQLKQEPLDVIVCSDLARSYDTAKVVAGYHGKQPQPTPLLREMDWGIYTGETLSDNAQKFFDFALSAEAAQYITTAGTSERPASKSEAKRS